MGRTEVPEQVPQRESWRQVERLALAMVEHEVVVPGDPPAAVVKLQMVESAQQDSSIEVGAPAIGPAVDVMGLAV